MTLNQPASLPFGSNEDQTKVGGVVLNQFLAGRNRLAETATIESDKFVTGVDGFRLSGDGSAEFNNLIARGTFRTAAPPLQRIEVAATTSVFSLFSGNGAETSEASLGLVDGGTYPQLTMQNAVYADGGDPQQVDMVEPIAGQRTLALYGGKPAAGNRGRVYIQPQATEGRVNIRSSEALALWNVSDVASFGNTLVGGALPNNLTDPMPYVIAGTEAPVFAVGTGMANFALPRGGFANGILGVVANLGGNANLGFLTIDDVNTTKTTLHLYGWSIAGAVLTGARKVSYIAIGW